MAHPVIIIGAGVGGLTAAALLAARGRDVVVCEAAAASGGKLRQVAIDGRPIDAGPTVFTMRWVFDEIFAAAGRSLADYIVLTPADRLARHAWSEAAFLDLHADLGRSADAIGDFAGAAEAAAFRRFMTDAARTYEVLRDTFLARAATSPTGLARRIGLTRPSALAAIHPFTTLSRALAGYFRDPRLRQLFGRYATYSGASPFLAPATLMLIAQVEAEGVWAVGGGMHSLAQALARLANDFGADIRYGAQVTEILTGKKGVEGVRLASGERIAGAAVVMNGDPQALAEGCLGPAVVRAVPALAARERSFSAVTWTLTAATSGFDLDHHNVFFSADDVNEFKTLTDGRLAADPSVYICASDRAPGVDRIAGREALHVIVNAPAVGAALSEGDLARTDVAMRVTIARCGLVMDEGSIIRTTPADFARLFPATGGALYGRASHGWRASFLRPGATTRVPRLFMAGGATHPGAGVPMAALSGRQAALAVAKALE